RSAAREYRLLDPEFIETAEMFRVNLYRQDITSNVGENVGDVGENVGDVGENTNSDVKVREKIIRMIESNNKSSASEIAQKLLISKRTVERYIRELRAEEKLVRHGAARGGYWEIKN
ncbi:MAG: HTH domain-containing protein, partial [Lachnospiraceae bacterium]|nr:HTH domain-containing protein [Lachnospiraceae bacterium]